MKKIIYSIFAFMFLHFTGGAQGATPNGSFENWTSTSYEYPVGYSNSNAQAFFRCNTPFNVVKTTDFYNGNFAVQLTTYIGNDTCFGYIVSSPNPEGANPCNWPGGIPFNQMPTGIMGYYKSNIQSPDSAGLLVGFRKNGICIGLYMYKFGGVNNTSYVPFSFTFNPPLAVTPDTLVFAAISSDVFNNIGLNGSMLQLDSISLIGVTQPAALNGDFENWAMKTIDLPNNWYTSADGNGMDIVKTTDVSNGNFAVEMVTRLGDNNGVPRANSSGVSTGYWINNCSGSNCQKGGTPFTNQIDTLCFYYKYAPMANDTAYASITFKNGGTVLWNYGVYVPNPASSYMYFEAPFNTMNTIDTVIVSFESSIWKDTALAFVGSSFKIDDVFFKSAGSTTAVPYLKNVPSSIYPNPSFDGNFVIDNVGKHDLVRVMNVYGQEVNFSIQKQNNKATVHVNEPGAYMVYINARGKISNHKVIVGKE